MPPARDAGAGEGTYGRRVGGHHPVKDGVDRVGHAASSRAADEAVLALILPVASNEFLKTFLRKGGVQGQKTQQPRNAPPQPRPGLTVRRRTGDVEGVQDGTGYAAPQPAQDRTEPPFGSRAIAVGGVRV